MGTLLIGKCRGAAGGRLWVVSEVRASACERGFEIPIGALQYM